MAVVGHSPPLEPLRDALLLRLGILSVFPSKTSSTVTITMMDVQEVYRNMLSSLSKQREALIRRTVIRIKTMMMMIILHTGNFHCPNNEK